MGNELRWLALWIVIFVALTVAMLKFVVPHHFNDRIAVMLSGIISGLLLIAIRARTTRRA